MSRERHTAQDISYANSAESMPGQTVVKLLENATGRLTLIKRARGYQDEVARGRDFWQVIVERYGLSWVTANVMSRRAWVQSRWLAAKGWKT